MIISEILRKKKILDRAKTKITDLIYSTFSFPNSNVGSGIAVVNEYENMRPDLLSNRIYSDQGKWDAILKYNGISNPFSLESGRILSIIPFSYIEEVYSIPNIINERVGKDDIGVEAIPVNRKDKRRVENLANKASVGKGGALPPNIAKEGDKSVKVKEGRLVFGEDVTTVNKANCPVPISRARLQNALLKDKLFL